MGYRDQQEALQWRRRKLEEQLYAIEEELEHHEQLEQRAKDIRKELHRVLDLQIAQQRRVSSGYVWAAVGAVGLLSVALGGIFMVLPRYTHGVSQTTGAMTRNIRAITVQAEALHPSSSCPTVGSLVHKGELAEGQQTDPWDTPFRIDCRADDITVTSAGPDRRFGSHDDISAGPRL